MNIEKKVLLQAEVKDEQGRVVAQMSSQLEGDGATPVIMTTGSGNIVGYHDDGSAIVSDELNKLLDKARTEFMSEAISEQKKLSEANGIDPSVVNIIGAEKEN